MLPTLAGIVYRGPWVRVRLPLVGEDQRRFRTNADGSRADTPSAGLRPALFGLDRACRTQRSQAHGCSVNPVRGQAMDGAAHGMSKASRGNLLFAFLAEVFDQELNLVVHGATPGLYGRHGHGELAKLSNRSR